MPDTAFSPSAYNALTSSITTAREAIFFAIRYLPSSPKHAKELIDSAFTKEGSAALYANLVITQNCIHLLSSKDLDIIPSVIQVLHRHRNDHPLLSEVKALRDAVISLLPDVLRAIPESNDALSSYPLSDIPAEASAFGAEYAVIQWLITHQATYAHSTSMLEAFFKRSINNASHLHVTQSIALFKLHADACLRGLRSPSLSFETSLLHALNAPITSIEFQSLVTSISILLLRHPEAAQLFGAFRPLLMQHMFSFPKGAQRAFQLARNVKGLSSRDLQVFQNLGKLYGALPDFSEASQIELYLHETQVIFHLNAPSDAYEHQQFLATSVLRLFPPLMTLGATKVPMLEVLEADVQLALQRVVATSATYLAAHPLEEAYRGEKALVQRHLTQNYYLQLLSRSVGFDRDSLLKDYANTEPDKVKLADFLMLLASLWEETNFSLFPDIIARFAEKYPQPFSGIPLLLWQNAIHQLEDYIEHHYASLCHNQDTILPLYYAYMAMLHRSAFFAHMDSIDRTASPALRVLLSLVLHHAPGATEIASSDTYFAADPLMAQYRFMQELKQWLISPKPTLSPDTIWPLLSHIKSTYVLASQKFSQIDCYQQEKDRVAALVADTLEILTTFLQSPAYNAGFGELLTCDVFLHMLAFTKATSFKEKGLAFKNFFSQHGSLLTSTNKHQDVLSLIDLMIHGDPTSPARVAVLNLIRSVIAYYSPILSINTPTSLAVVCNTAHSGLNTLSLSFKDNKALVRMQRFIEQMQSEILHLMDGSIPLYDEAPRFTKADYVMHVPSILVHVFERALDTNSTHHKDAFIYLHALNNNLILHAQHKTAFAVPLSALCQAVLSLEKAEIPDLKDCYLLLDRPVFGKVQQLLFTHIQNAFSKAEELFLEQEKIPASIKHTLYEQTEGPAFLLPLLQASFCTLKEVQQQALRLLRRISVYLEPISGADNKRVWIAALVETVLRYHEATESKESKESNNVIRCKETLDFLKRCMQQLDDWNPASPLPYPALRTWALTYFTKHVHASIEVQQTELFHYLEQNIWNYASLREAEQIVRSCQPYFQQNHSYWHGCTFLLAQITYSTYAKQCTEWLEHADISLQDLQVFAKNISALCNTVLTSYASFPRNLAPLKQLSSLLAQEQSRTQKLLNLCNCISNLNKQPIEHIATQAKALHYAKVKNPLMAAVTHYFYMEYLLHVPFGEALPDVFSCILRRTEESLSAALILHKENPLICALLQAMERHMHSPAIQEVLSHQAAFDAHIRKHHMVIEGLETYLESEIFTQPLSPSQIATLAGAVLSQVSIDTSASFSKNALQDMIERTIGTRLKEQSSSFSPPITPQIAYLYQRIARQQPAPVPANLLDISLQQLGIEYLQERLTAQSEKHPLHAFKKVLPNLTSLSLHAKQQFYLTPQLQSVPFAERIAVGEMQAARG